MEIIMSDIDRVKRRLEYGGYDGLCNDRCGCSIDDLAPCDDMQNDCRPGYIHHHSDGYAIIASDKQPMADDEIDRLLS
jgi:hypothetical protein